MIVGRVCVLASPDGEILSWSWFGCDFRRLITLNVSNQLRVKDCVTYHLVLLQAEVVRASRPAYCTHLCNKRPPLYVNYRKIPKKLDY